jgi:hypothetical protein
LCVKYFSAKSCYGNPDLLLSTFQETNIVWARTLTPDVLLPLHHPGQALLRLFIFLDINYL